MNNITDAQALVIAKEIKSAGISVVCSEFGFGRIPDPNNPTNSLKIMGFLDKDHKHKKVAVANGKYLIDTTCIYKVTQDGGASDDKGTAKLLKADNSTGTIDVIIKNL